MEHEISLYYYENNNDIKAIAPLILIKRHGLKQFEIVGSSFLYEPIGFLYKDKNALINLFRGLINIKIPIILQRIHHNIDLFKRNEKIIRYPSLIINKQVSGTPWISTKMNWESYFNSISSKRKYELRRRQKRANELGEMNFEFITPENDQFKSLTQRAFEIESSGWKRKTGSGIMVNKNLNQFFSEYLYNASLENILRYAFLKIDEKYIATMICLEYSNRLWVLKIGYDENFTKFAPGVLLFFHTIKKSFEMNLSAVEILGTEDSWKRDWSNNIHEHFTTIIYPFSYNGYGRLLLDGFSWVRNKIKHY